MKKYAPLLVCLGIVFILHGVLRTNGYGLSKWQADPGGRAALDLLRNVPYACFILSAVWAARIANTPVYVLSLILIPSQYYFSGGSVFVGSGEQMRFVLFLLLPVLVTLALFVSHRTLACTIRTGVVTLGLGFVVPPVVSAVLGREILLWIGSFRWEGAGVLGAPSSPTLYYLAVFLFNLMIPFGGREGLMKKLLAILIPCFYFSGVFKPVFQSGPLYPPGVEEPAFVVFTSAAAGLTVYANFFLSWTKAYVDDLTQVLGRRALNEALVHLSGAYAIAMIDIDHFKKFNDTYGHAAGDTVLREVAALLSENSGGQVYRYGGEEFSVLYPNLDAAAAAARLDAVRRLLSETKIPLNGTSPAKREKKVSVQISGGVSECGKKYATPEEVIRSADRALYKAKENGRNRVEQA